MKENILNDKEIAKVISEKLGDPKTELPNSALWKSLLKYLLPISERLYQAFRGLRASNANLEINEDNLNFSFPSNYDDDFKALIKKKYIKPYASLIKDAMKKVVAIEKAKETGFSKRIPI